MTTYGTHADARRCDTASTEANASYTTADVLVYAVIVGVGAMHYALSLRSDDFFRGDTTYFELARSLLTQRFYGFDFRAETAVPPGFAAILALLCVTVGCTYSALLHSVAVFSTLGFLVGYELLRREQGRAAGAIICLSLISSPFLFTFETGLVFSDLPYLFTSMLVLVLVMRLDRTTSSGVRVIVWPLCAVALVSSLLIRSAGIALVAGLMAWLAVSSLTQRKTAGRRLKTFLPLVAAAILVQATWMYWVATHEFIEWPIGGYPRSYVAQLHVKSGNHPEMGTASLADIPPRVAKNLIEHLAGLAPLLTQQQWINPVWSSPAVVGPLLLIVAGLGGSMWPAGGHVTEWYFIMHEAIYLLWPWDLELRFLLPIVPLAGLYLWRGGVMLVGWAARRPRTVSACTVLVSLPAAAHAGAFAWRFGSRQLALAVVFWTLLAVLGAAVVYADPRRLGAVVDRLRWRAIPVPPLRGASISVLGAVCVLAVAISVGIGVARQTRLGLDNLAFDLTTRPSYPDIQAAKWIHGHTSTTAVVMARQKDVVYHYSRRRVIWFPPISDPRTLMEGINKYGVEFVIINHRQSSYWRPPEEECFAALSTAYPSSFRLVQEGPRFRIFAVTRD